MERKTYSKTRIVQMMPASGWRVVFASHVKDEVFVAVPIPLIGWGLSEEWTVSCKDDSITYSEEAIPHKRERYVKGLIVEDRKYIDEADTVDGFLGYLEPDMPFRQEDWAEELSDYESRVRTRSKGAEESK